ncbi:MAG TPA: serine/threonine-protein kinase [Kofleriaceae bacterium]|nr:serine/threonine-protein kinase [Kofleriaceae bacterium]
MSTGVQHDGLIGEVLGERYCLEARLGHGAMGSVFRARHVEVGRAFAIKILHPRLLGDERIRKRFAREARLAGALHHPNAVSVLDVGEARDGRRYLVMEYADGPTLLDLIEASGPLPGPRFVAIVRQLCSGLQHAHELGLIHRDFKPENVIIERDRHGVETPRIVDFGVAILRDDAVAPGAGRLTTAGLVLGTPHYMAPEHATGAPIDHRIDLFALGVTCYEMLAGCAPFEGDGVDVARANLLLDPPAMCARVPGLAVDPLLEAFTRKLMMRPRDARPATARAARDLLDRIEHDRSGAASALGITLPIPRPAVAIPALARAVAAAPPPPDLAPRAQEAPGEAWPPVMAATADLTAGLDPGWPGAASAGANAAGIDAPVASLGFDATEQMPPVRPRRTHRVASAVAGLAVLAVLAALVIAVMLRRADHATPRGTASSSLLMR